MTPTGAAAPSGSPSKQPDQLEEPRQAVPKAMALAWPGPAPAWPDLERRAGPASCSLRETRDSGCQSRSSWAPSRVLPKDMQGPGEQVWASGGRCPFLDTEGFKGSFQGEPSSEKPSGPAAQRPEPTPPPATSQAAGSPAPPSDCGRSGAVGWLRGHTLPSLCVGMDFAAGVRGVERGVLLLTPAARSPLQPELHLLQPVLPAGRSTWGPRLGRTALEGRGSGVGGLGRRGLRCCGRHGGVSE